ncbi:MULTISPECIES: hypothetical protein [unclassified Streptomyces]|uniref:hypothetical protein n=1 Tax=unclassified Streptomyces TaxID=2593676 RepID=UPI000BAC5EA1|nr:MULTISPECIES: hypothetical protein [unclassified Streptomyces]MYX20439.1 hypothetical protein [Streptomyces sp. SID8380]
MIRADRQHLVRTLADIAEERGIALQTLLNSGLHRAKGFPAPLNTGRTKLFDDEQVDAHFKSLPVPPIPDQGERDDDLLDRQEAAELREMTPQQWDTRRKTPAVRDHVVLVRGVEHWPRHVIREHTLARRGAAPGSGSGGRPRGAADQIPRDLLPARVEQLLDADPALTAARVSEVLGVHRDTATTALLHCRASRMADLMERQGITAAQAAEALGYPPGQVRRARGRAAAVRRGRAARPYLAEVTAELHARGWTSADSTPTIQYLDDSTCAAVLTLAASAPAPALVWAERLGWRTAVSRRHPLGRPEDWTAPPEGVHVLATDPTASVAPLLQALDGVTDAGG